MAEVHELRAAQPDASRVPPRWQRQALRRLEHFRQQTAEALDSLGATDDDHAVLAGLVDTLRQRMLADS